MIPDLMPHAPKFVLSAGMVGSGSTFLFNVARELLIHDLPDPAPLALYSDEWNERYRAPRSLIVKCHGGSPGLLTAAEQGLVRPLVTIRHPGDCVCSDMERFGHSFAEAVARVETSLAFAAMLARLEGTTIFRYEDGFAFDPLTPAAVARRLGIEAGAGVLARIYSRYDVERTRLLADRVETQPDSLSNLANGDVWSLVTQIHRGHIGKLACGRWRDLSPLALTIVAERCGDHARAFGYGFDRDRG